MTQLKQKCNIEFYFVDLNTRVRIDAIEFLWPEIDKGIRYCSDLLLRPKNAGSRNEHLKHFRVLRILD